MQREDHGQDEAEAPHRQRAHEAGADDEPEDIRSRVPEHGHLSKIDRKSGCGDNDHRAREIPRPAPRGNDKGEILLVKRADSGVWLYPTGWADIGYSASEVVVKEVLEETGIEVEPVRLIMVLDGLRLGFTRIPLYSLVFLCKAIGGELSAHPLECADVGWFAQHDLPMPLAGSDRWMEHVFAAIRGERVEVLFDSPRQPTWRGKI